MMGVERGEAEVGAFEAFLQASERRLRVALVAAYGPVDGRSAALDALSWAWEHWDEVRSMANPLGYLYRVGQTAARRHRARPIPIDATSWVDHAELPDVHPELVPALARLTEQQRAAVLLVHAFGWPVREAAAALGLAPSTLQTHVERGVRNLRTLLEVHDVH